MFYNKSLLLSKLWVTCIVLLSLWCMGYASKCAAIISPKEIGTLEDVLNKLEPKSVVCFKNEEYKIKNTIHVPDKQFTFRPLLTGFSVHQPKSLNDSCPVFVVAIDNSSPGFVSHGGNEFDGIAFTATKGSSIIDFRLMKDSFAVLGKCYFELSDDSVSTMITTSGEALGNLNFHQSIVKAKNIDSIIETRGNGILIDRSKIEHQISHGKTTGKPSFRLAGSVALIENSYIVSSFGSSSLFEVSTLESQNSTTPIEFYASSFANAPTAIDLEDLQVSLLFSNSTFSLFDQFIKGVPKSLKGSNMCLSSCGEFASDISDSSVITNITESWWGYPQGPSPPGYGIHLNPDFHSLVQPVVTQQDQLCHSLPINFNIDGFSYINMDQDSFSVNLSPNFDFEFPSSIDVHLMNDNLNINESTTLSKTSSGSKTTYPWNNIIKNLKSKYGADSLKGENMTMIAKPNDGNYSFAKFFRKFQLSPRISIQFDRNIPHINLEYQQFVSIEYSTTGLIESVDISLIEVEGIYNSSKTETYDRIGASQSVNMQIPIGTNSNHWKVVIAASNHPDISASATFETYRKYVGSSSSEIDYSSAATVSIDNSLFSLIIIMSYFLSMMF
eukprot:gb/GECH01011309.1/.p1 GENE.gb/GECH01011309.1/~~gb/GECH01011309.1/.p1  ORF type:complete len:613 (+),score=115.41 gb/GECH01011309.1/:1-1839(+)